MAATNELDIIIKVQSDMKKQLDEATASIKKMKEKSKKATSGMEANFRKLGKAIQAAMGSAVIKTGAMMIKTAEKQSLALAILKTKSKDVYDQLQQTSEATFGLANKFDMITAANKAMAFGIDLSGGRLKDLMKISSKLAAVMGIETKQAFDDLITSSARQQKLIADNLGVMIDKVKVDQEYAEVLGKTSSELTEMEQSQAFLNEILKKGAVITGDLTDEFIKMNTQGTQAIKRLETAFTASTNAIARGFVGLGEGIGEFFALLQGHRIKDVSAARKAFLDETSKTKIELEKRYSDRAEQLKKAGKTEHEIFIKIQSARNRNDTKFMLSNFRKWKSYYDARQELNKRFLADEKTQAKLELDINEEFADDGVWVGGRIVSRSSIDKIMSNTNSFIKKAKDERAKNTKVKKGKGVKSMIFDESDADGIERALKKENEAIEAALLEGTESHDELLERRYQEKISWNEQTQKMLDDYAKVEVDREKKVALEKKRISLEEQKAKERHFNMMKRFGSEYLSAIISGNADQIPKILAQQAMMFGQELVYDGIKTLWMGTAANSLFPGTGLPAMAVGAAEIGVGVGMMGVGYAANSALPSSSDGDSGASERNASNDNGNQDFNFNVTTSLYGSEVKAKREIRKIVS